MEEQNKVEMNYPVFLESISVTFYEIKFRALSDGKLPTFLGSTLRGLFGNSLWKSFCKNLSNEPFTCGEQCNCLVKDIWEPVPSKDHPRYRALKDSCPKPFVIQTEFRNSSEIKRGDMVSFRLGMFGDLKDHIFQLIPVFDRMAKSGFGEARIPFEMVGVGGSGVFEAAKPVRFVDFNIEPYIGKRIGVRFVSPCLLIEKGKMNDTISFVSIIRSLLERANIIGSLYCGSAYLNDISEGFGEMISRAEKVRITKQHLETKNIYRKNGKSWLRGQMGSVEYYGEVGPFIPLLSFGQYFHIGQETSFGCGQYVVEHIQSKLSTSNA